MITGMISNGNTRSIGELLRAWFVSLGYAARHRPLLGPAGRRLERSALSEDEVEIAEIYEQPHAPAEVPKRDRDHAASLPFAPPPLDKKARKEHSLAKKAHQQPDVVQRDPREGLGQHQISTTSIEGRKRRINQRTPRRSRIPT